MEYRIRSLAVKTRRSVKRVHPGPGLKLRHGGLTPEASGTKLQASSFRTNLVKHQATSGKATSTGVKRQATSSKLSDPCTTVQEY